MNGDAAASLKRLNRLKPSAINSSRTRSPIGTNLATRRSRETYRCVRPKLRAKLPLVNWPFVINGAQPAVPGTHSVPSSSTDGRSVWFDWSLFVSWLLRMLNGRPDEISKIGATVNLESARWKPPSLAQLLGEAITPLNTKRWR